MDDANPELEAGPQQVYDHVRRSFGGLHLTPGSYTEIFTGSKRWNTQDETKSLERSYQPITCFYGEIIFATLA
jgi:hypothetical protein